MLDLSQRAVLVVGQDLDDIGNPFRSIAFVENLDNFAPGDFSGAFLYRALNII